MDDLDDLSHSLAKTTLRICVSRIGTTYCGIAGSVSPAQRHVVCPPFQWLVVCGDVDEKRREVVQSSRLVCDKGSKFAVLLTRASSCAGDLGAHGHLGLSIVVPHKTRDVEHAVGFLGSASNPHAIEVESEAWTASKIPNAYCRHLFTCWNNRNLDHQISGGRLVRRN